MNIDKIVCVGKNYLEHSKELGDAIPEKPVLFLKPASILKQATHWGEMLYASLPNQTDEIHYECEVVLRLDANQKITAVTLGLDMTNRTIQAKLKKNGHPWTTGKVFVDSAIIGPWTPVADFPDYLSAPFQFELNGEVRQAATLKTAILQPQAILEYASSYFPLCQDDLVFTGTPVGVGSIKSGDTGRLSWNNLQFQVTWA